LFFDHAPKSALQQQQSESFNALQAATCSYLPSGIVATVASVLRKCSTHLDFKAERQAH